MKPTEAAALESYEIDDPNFINDLRYSREAVDRAAAWLSSMGYPVIIRPTFERPDVTQMREYSDCGDLEIIQRVEVKRRINIKFTSELDFPYDTVIVDACHCYDNAKPKPYQYIIFNNPMTTAIIVDCKTKRDWIITEKTDRFKKRNRRFYECPIKLVKFQLIQ